MCNIIDSLIIFKLHVQHALLKAFFREARKQMKKTVTIFNDFTQKNPLLIYKQIKISLLKL